MLVGLLEKLDQNKIVSKNIRQTYYTLSKEFFKKLNGKLDSMVPLQKLNIFIKKDIGEYIDKNITELLLFETYHKDEVNYVVIDQETLSFNQKIKAYVTSHDSLPDNFYKERKGKYMSTIGLSINTVHAFLDKLSKMESILKDKITDLESINADSLNKKSLHLK